MQQPELRDQCQHRWPDLFRSFCVDEKILNKKHQACPLCGEGKDRFRFTDYMGMGYVVCNQCMPNSVDGIEFLQRFTGMTFTQLAESIRNMLGETEARPEPKADQRKIKSRLTGIWKESAPLSKGDATHRYLYNRGLNKIKFSELQGLRTHPAMPYYEIQNDKPVMVGKFPTMVALVTDPLGNPATLHCTYLTKDGQKADLSPARKVMPPYVPYTGGAVRLEKLNPGQVLCVAEGIETTLSLKQMYPDVCAWACLDAGNMKKFCVPENTTIMIGADADESYTGQLAAFQLAHDLSKKNIKVSVVIPDELGTDWNDVIQPILRAAS